MLMEHLKNTTGNMIKISLTEKELAYLYDLVVAAKTEGLPSSLEGTDSFIKVLHFKFGRLIKKVFEGEK